MSEKKEPRLLPIPKEIQPVIATLFKRTQFDDAWIADMCANMLVTIGSISKDHENTVDKFIRSAFPEGTNFEQYSIDASCRVVMELDDNHEKTGRHFTLPESYAISLERIINENGSLKIATALVADVGMRMSENVQNDAAELYNIIRSHLPQCDKDSWVLDINNMVMREKIMEEEAEEA